MSLALAVNGHARGKLAMSGLWPLSIMRAAAGNAGCSVFLSHFGLLCYRIRNTSPSNVPGSAREPRRARQAACGRECAMVRVLNEILLYSGMAAFVTGIVVLAAATWIS